MTRECESPLPPGNVPGVRQRFPLIAALVLLLIDNLDLVI
jgi:hypothetical protein